MTLRRTLPAALTQAFSVRDCRLYLLTVKLPLQILAKIIECLLGRLLSEMHNKIGIMFFLVLSTCPVDVRQLVWHNCTGQSNVKQEHSNDEETSINIKYCCGVVATFVSNLDTTDILFTSTANGC